MAGLTPSAAADGECAPSVFNLTSYPPVIKRGREGGKRGREKKFCAKLLHRRDEIGIFKREWNKSPERQIMITNNIFDILKQNLSFMKKKFSVKKIGVFGSYATGKPTESSDVDIVVVFEKPVGLSFVDFSEYIENLLGRPADILTPAGIAAIRNKKIANTIQGQIKYV